MTSANSHQVIGTFHFGVSSVAGEMTFRKETPTAPPWHSDSATWRSCSTSVLNYTRVRFFFDDNRTSGRQKSQKYFYRHILPIGLSGLVTLASFPVLMDYGIKNPYPLLDHITNVYAMMRVGRVTCGSCIFIRANRPPPTCILASPPRSVDRISHYWYMLCQYHTPPPVSSSSGFSAPGPSRRTASYRILYDRHLPHDSRLNVPDSRLPVNQPWSLPSQD